jgi:hypothetical protein
MCKEKIDVNKQAIRDALKNRQYLDGTNFISMVLAKEVWVMCDVDDIEQVRGHP